METSPNAVLETAPDAAVETRPNRAMEIRPATKTTTVAAGRIVLAAMMIIVGLGLGVARAANRAGWVPHRQDTTVYFGRGDWTVNEDRSCIALPESDGGVIFLSCVAGRSPELSPEVWPVTYWGQTRRVDMYEYVHADPGIHTWNWHCRRFRASLTCWAVN